jgi:amidophosphoribosyltransferase
LPGSDRIGKNLLERSNQAGCEPGPDAEFEPTLTATDKTPRN